MTNTSHTHDRIPTNNPELWLFLAVLLMLCLTAKADADHIGIALAGATQAVTAAHLLRRNT